MTIRRYGYESYMFLWEYCIIACHRQRPGEGGKLSDRYHHYIICSCSFWTQTRSIWLFAYQQMCILYIYIYMSLYIYIMIALKAKGFRPFYRKPLAIQQLQSIYISIQRRTSQFSTRNSLPRLTRPVLILKI